MSLLDSTPTSDYCRSMPAQKTITLQLRNIPLLEDLDRAALENVAALLQIRSVERGEFLQRRNDIGKHLHFLLSGRLQTIEISGEGREIGSDIILPGEYFGDMAIIEGLPQPESIVASETSLVALLPRIHALRLIYNNPSVAERLLKRMVSRIRAASNHRAILAIPNAFQRVFAFLNQFTKIAPGGLVIIERMPTQQEIAISVNTSRETVSRAIQTLIQKGIVEKDLRRLIVRLPDALRDAAIPEQGLALENRVRSGPGNSDRGISDISASMGDGSRRPTGAESNEKTETQPHGRLQSQSSDRRAQGR